MLVRTDTTTTLTLTMFRPNLLRLSPLLLPGHVPGPKETDAHYQQRVTQGPGRGTNELNELKQWAIANNITDSAYTNVFAVPFNDYGRVRTQNPRVGTRSKNLTTIFASRFTSVFVRTTLSQQCLRRPPPIPL